MTPVNENKVSGLTLKGVIRLVCSRENQLLWTIIKQQINIENNDDFDYAFWIEKFYKDAQLERLPLPDDSITSYEDVIGYNLEMVEWPNYELIKEREAKLIKAAWFNGEHDTLYTINDEAWDDQADSRLYDAYKNAGLEKLP